MFSMLHIKSESSERVVIIDNSQRTKTGFYQPEVILRFQNRLLTIKNRFYPNTGFQDAKKMFLTYPRPPNRF